MKAKLRDLRGALENIGSGVTDTLARPGVDGAIAGSLYGAGSGAISNYLAGGDLDHAIRGAVVGGALGAGSGALVSKSNPLLHFGVTTSVPAALAFQKNRPMLREAYEPKSTDVLNRLYTEERAFAEGTPEFEEYYMANPERYQARLEKMSTYKAPMSLDEIAYMEEISGDYVGRTQTKVGTIVDSNGVFSLYDSTGENLYGEFTKLSEAKEYAEKVAARYVVEGKGSDAVVREYGRFSRFNPFAQGRVVASAGFVRPGTHGPGQFSMNIAPDLKADSGKFFTSQGKLTADLNRRDAMQQFYLEQRQGMGEENYRKFQEKLNPARAEAGLKQVDPYSPPAETPKQTQTQTKTQPQTKPKGTVISSSKGTASIDQLSQGVSPSKPNVQAPNTQMTTTPKPKPSPAAAPKPNQAAAKSLGKWGKGGLAGLAAAGLGYLGYQYFKPEETYWDATKGAIGDAYNYARQNASSIANVANTVGNVYNQATGTMAYNPYSVQSGQYQNIPNYYRRQY